MAAPAQVRQRHITNAAQTPGTATRCLLGPPVSGLEKKTLDGSVEELEMWRSRGKLKRGQNSRMKEGEKRDARVDWEVKWRRRWEVGGGTQNILLSAWWRRKGRRFLLEILLQMDSSRVRDFKMSK